MLHIRSMRSAIAAGFRRMITGDPAGQPEWVRALETGTDAGYFGPDSAAWAVHGALPTLIGGMRALLMQALHPGALAGVLQHSRYESDPLGRLAGTTQWLTVVTFGDRAAADRECARVRGMHRRVRGQYPTPAGPRDYTADDQDLLRWVHIAFTDSFLAAHRVWGGAIPGGEDAYVREWAIAGELVGLADPPRSVAELNAQVAGYAGVLRGSDDARRTAAFVRDMPVAAAGAPAYRALFNGAVATLPAPAQARLGISAPPLPIARAMAGAVLGGLRLALGPYSPSQQAAFRRLDSL